jgi:hypothetical protein
MVFAVFAQTNSGLRWRPLHIPVIKTQKCRTIVKKSALPRPVARTRYGFPALSSRTIASSLVSYPWDAHYLFLPFRNARGKMTEGPRSNFSKLSRDRLRHVIVGEALGAALIIRFAVALS